MLNTEQENQKTPIQVLTPEELETVIGGDEGGSGFGYSTY